MNKVIFLDIDGVLATPSYVKHEVEVLKRVNGFSYEEAKFHTKDEYGDLFDPIAVDSLREIIRSTGGKLVITSSRAKGKSLSYFTGMWSHRNLPGEIIHVFNEIDKDKETQLIDYIMNHEKDIESYLILDDKDMKISNSQVLIDSEYGLSNRDIAKSILILNNYSNTYGN